MEASYTIPRELPLKRPIESSATTELVEKSLQRPDNGSEKIFYSDSVAVFAVDTSGSTQGKVLKEEKEVIKTLCSGFSREASRQANIIPWSNEVQSLVSVDGLETLFSSGGTIPSRLHASPQARLALSKCSAWFLLTDGEIGLQEIQGFSRGICEAGLHGTPCVIILFGYKTTRPVGCNISVGLSVFSSAADCLFLFHDIDTAQVYILQTKGVFNVMISPGEHELILDARTVWSDIPLFNYRQLFNLFLPTRQPLGPNDLLLQSRHKIRLQDLYQNQVDRSTADEILSNNDNLQSVLLAAQLRGDDDKIRQWISEQRIGGEDILVCERPDVDQKAFVAMRALFSALAQPDPDDRIPALQHDLRTAHQTNWIKFVSILRRKYNDMSERSSVVSNVMERISFNRNQINSSRSSSEMLSSVFSSLNKRESQLYHSRHHPRFQEDSDQYTLHFANDSYTLGPPQRLQDRRLPQTSNAAIAPSQPGFRNPAPKTTNRFNLHDLKSSLEGECNGVLYIQRYKYRQGYSSDGVLGTCPACKERNVLLVFLLKSPPTDISTPNFPQPNARKGLAYPLAMGTYPETDILSSQVCCDSCANTIIHGKIEYDGDKVTAAIPIMQAAFSGDYKSTTLRLIDTALKKRFQKSLVKPIFLSIIYSTLADLDDNNFELRFKAYKTASSWIAATTQLPLCLSMTTISSTPQSSIDVQPMPMIEVLKKNIENVQQPKPPLLQYPVGGFVVLMLAITDVNQFASVQACKLAVWHRFWFHLFEKYSAVLASNQSKAVLMLQNILSVLAEIQMDHADNPHTKPVSKNPTEPEKVFMDDPQIEVMDSPVPAQPRFMPSAALKAICGTH